MMNIILAVNDAQTVHMDVYNPNMYLHQIEVNYKLKFNDVCYLN